MGTTTPAGPNNWRNWVPLVGTYLYVFAVAAAALWFFREREGWLPWWTDIPVGIVAILLIGPAQHRLMILGQEAALGVLFRNRWLNELVGDWLIHFPFSTATHHVRQHLLTHYRYPNDPERDAELIVAQRAGFSPLRWTRLLRASAYIKWNSLRATHIFEPDPNNPFFDLAKPPSKVALRIGTVYVLSTFALLLCLYFFRRELGDDVIRIVLTYVLPGLWVLAMIVFAALPASKYHRGRLDGVYSPKAMTLMRVTFISLINAGLGWTTYLTERSAVLNYIVLWIAPIGVAAALILIRQWRQHGKPAAGTGRVGSEPRPGWKALALPAQPASAYGQTCPARDAVVRTAVQMTQGCQGKAAKQSKAANLGSLDSQSQVINGMGVISSFGASLPRLPTPAPLVRIAFSFLHKALRLNKPPGPS